MLLTLTTLAAAATWTANDTLTLQAAVSLASAGDTVQIDADLYDPESDVQVWIDKDLTVESSDTVDTAPIPPMLITDATVELNRLRLSGETVKAVGGFLNPSTSELVECSTCGVMVYDNALVTATGLEATAWGGETAVRVLDAKASLGDIRLEGIQTPISVESAGGNTQLTLDGCRIAQNTQPVTATGSATAASISVEIDSCTFSNNASNGGPADLLLTQVDYLLINDTAFEDSSSNDSAGSVEVYDVGDADLDNNSWTGVEGRRGALTFVSTTDEASMPRVDLTHLDFLANTQAGGLEADGYVRLVSSDLKFEGNSASSGGAVRLDQAQFECTACRFLDNTATDSGGAIEANGATMDLERSWFCGNSSGGASILSTTGGSTSMSHTVLMDQSGEISSVEVDGGGGLDLINVTWTGVDGYALSGNLADLRLWNSVVQGFQVGLAPATVTSSGAIDFNLWHDMDQASTNSSVQPGPEALFEDPLFAPRFDTAGCSWLPWPRAVSPVYDSYDTNYADFRGALGADLSFPWEDPPEEGDSADSDSEPWIPESDLDSPIDSPTDSPSADSDPPTDLVTWVSGGCGGQGGVPAALAVLGLGAALVSRRR
jgi:predicted outer membrane repeat protein